jgi:hypothetical protein
MTFLWPFFFFFFLSLQATMWALSFQGVCLKKAIHLSTSCSQVISFVICSFPRISSLPSFVYIYFLHYTAEQTHTALYRYVCTPTTHDCQHISKSPRANLRSLHAEHVLAIREICSTNKTRAGSSYCKLFLRLFFYKQNAGMSYV